MFMLLLQSNIIKVIDRINDDLNVIDSFYLYEMLLCEVTQTVLDTSIYFFKKVGGFAFW